MGSLTDYLDKGASLGRDAPCLVEGDRTLSYGDVQDLSHRVAGALARDGIEPGAKVGILSSNNAVAFACVFGIARRGAVWCPINPRNEMAENRALLELFDCECLIYHAAYAPMAEQLDVRMKVCLDELDDWLGDTRPARGRARGRPGDARRHRRHDRAAEGRDAHQPQPRDDDRADADGVSVQRPPRVPRARPAHPRRGRVVLPGDDARRAHRRDAQARCRRVHRPDRARAHHAHVPAADADLHAARPRGDRHHRPLLTAVLLVRRGADVHRAARRGPARDRPDGPAVRADRGADDGLDAAARGALQRGRDGRDEAPRLGRPARAAGHRRDHGPGHRPSFSRPASAARSSCAARS